MAVRRAADLSPARVRCSTSGTVLGNAGAGPLVVNISSFTNAGTVAVMQGGIAAIEATAFTNLAGGTLTGGTYLVSGNGSAINLLLQGGGSAAVASDNATITLAGIGSSLLAFDPGFGSGGGFRSLEDTLASNAAAGQLNILTGRDYTSAHTLDNAGKLTLGGGTLAPAGLVNEGGATIAGFGTVLAAIGNGGLVEAQGGTLLLAGGITDTGELRTDPRGTLAFDGSYSQAVANDGIIAVPIGTLSLSGIVTGDGGFFIQGGAAGDTTALSLHTASSGQVAFNGAAGELQLFSPGAFTGSLVGFGEGDAIDLVGLVSDGATLAGDTLSLLYGGATVDTIAFVGDYSAASFSGGDDGLGGTLITLSGVQPRDFALEGAVWHGETISWSLASAQLSGPLDNAHPYSNFIDPVAQAAEVAVIEQALQAWARASGLDFVEVADSTTADIRIGWGDLLGIGGEIGEAAFNSNGPTIQQDMIVRLEDPAEDPLVSTPGVTGGLTYGGQSATLYQVALHELGHALGLAHSTDFNAVMFPAAQG